MGYEETLKDTMETEAEEEAKEQQQDDDYEQYDIVPNMKLVHEGISTKQFRMAGNFNGVMSAMSATSTQGCLSLTLHDKLRWDVGKLRCGKK